MLKRKVFRDIKISLSQFITIFLMVFLGVLVYSGIRSYMDGMIKTANNFYKEYNLQDLNIISSNFTKKDLKKIKKIDGVKNVERKLTVIGTMDNKEDRTLQLNFIEANEISKFYVSDGEAFDKNKSGIWIDEFYSKNNNLDVGDIVTIKYDKEILKEKIIGLINVPDHIYDIKDESEIFPNHIDYGFCYLSINEFPSNYIKKQVMQQMNISKETLFDEIVPEFNYKDYLIYNYAMVDVDDITKVNDVKLDIEDKIESAIAVIDIKDSISYSTYQGEIEEGETYVGVFSGLFLFIAMLSVLTTMTRVVKKQRIQIGTLKALGFSNKKITIHYISYGFWISFIAAIFGLIVGPIFIGNIFMNMEMKVFQIPNSHVEVRLNSFIIGLLVIIIVCFITYVACRSELKENPVETLRLKIPKVKKESLNITTKGIFKRMDFSVKWNLRDIIRNKIRTFMAIAGITGCTMLLVCAFGMLDTIKSFISWQFDDLYNFNYKLSLKEEYNYEDYNKLTAKYGDNTSQTLEIEIKQDYKKQVNNIFIANTNDYVRFTDNKRNFINLQDGGIYVTKKFATNNNLKIGDTINWHILGNDKCYESKIIGFDRDPQNQNIKMTKNYLKSLGLKYKADTIYTNLDLSEVKELDGVKLIQNINSLKSGMLSMINTMKTIIILLIIVAAILGGVIIYNLGILSFTEKQYQFATLKVLGFKDKKIKSIYIKQNIWITIIAIILGLPLGYYITYFIFKMALSDTYDFSTDIRLLSYLYAIIGTFIVSYIVNKILSRKIKDINMVKSLKGNE